MQGPQWATRLVDAPADDLLTADQVGKLLGFGIETLTKLIKQGEFPESIHASPGVKVWEWKAVAYYRLRMELRARFQTETGGKRTETEG